MSTRATLNAQHVDGLQQQKTEVTIHRLTKFCDHMMSLNFCYNTRIVGSGFRVNSMKAWIPPGFYHCSVWWGYNGVRGYFLAHFGSLSTNTAYLSFVADHAHTFITTVYPSSGHCFQQDNAPCRKTQIISNWFGQHVTEFPVLMNLCHEELKQLWRQKRGQHGTSKLYLINCLSVYTNICVYYICKLKTAK